MGKPAWVLRLCDSRRPGHDAGLCWQGDKGLGQECFTADKLSKCNQTLADYARGTLVMFLLAAPAGRGRPAEKQINLLEDFLIQVGVAANDDLLNVQGAKQEQWALSGLVRSNRGRPSYAASAFKAAMKLRAG